MFYYITFVIKDGGDNKYVIRNLTDSELNEVEYLQIGTTSEMELLLMLIFIDSTIIHL